MRWKKKGSGAGDNWEEGDGGCGVYGVYHTAQTLESRNLARRRGRMMRRWGAPDMSYARDSPVISKELPVKSIMGQLSPISEAPTTMLIIGSRVKSAVVV